MPQKTLAIKALSGYLLWQEKEVAAALTKGRPGTIFLSRAKQRLYI
ncbi:MAG: hypothetical protein PW788_14715 [Micavibrio sp.]|nr:hypothetical protein [Micavibrio sp.]